MRKAHPTWGSKKTLWALDRGRPGHDWPARSQVDAILERAGVVEPSLAILEMASTNVLGLTLGVL